MTTARKTVTLEGRFAMYRGGHLESPTLAYETWGELNDARDNGVLIFSGLSPSAHAASSEDDPSAGWWEEMIGSGLIRQRRRFQMVAAEHCEAALQRDRFSCIRHDCVPNPGDSLYSKLNWDATRRPNL